MKYTIVRIKFPRKLSDKELAWLYRLIKRLYPKAEVVIEKVIR